MVERVMKRLQNLSILGLFNLDNVQLVGLLCGLWMYLCPCPVCLHHHVYFNSQLEGSLSQWTSYQEDVGQFVLWMDRVEETLGCSDRQYSEMRDKTANLGKTKVPHSANYSLCP